MDKHKNKIIWVIIFSVAMAFLESSVVYYLRIIYYPDGFKLPLKPIINETLIVELFRELATIIMLISIAVISGEKFWERFAYFIISFGIWDIFYYVFLKLILDWPASLLDWDILFLIPVPWIGPVIAPVTIALIMIICGIIILCFFKKGYELKPVFLSYIFVIIGMGLILYSFMYDTDATLTRLKQFEHKNNKI